MASPLTWRNVGSSLDIRGIGRAMEGASNQLRKSGTGIQNIFQDIANEQADARSLQANELINNLKTVEGFDNAGLTLSGLEKQLGGRLNKDVATNLAGQRQEAQDLFLSNQAFADKKQDIADRPLLAGHRNTLSQMTDAGAVKDYLSGITDVSQRGMIGLNKDFGLPYQDKLTVRSDRLDAQADDANTSNYFANMFQKNKERTTAGNLIAHQETAAKLGYKHLLDNNGQLNLTNLTSDKRKEAESLLMSNPNWEETGNIAAMTENFKKSSAYTGWETGAERDKALERFNQKLDGHFNLDKQQQFALDNTIADGNAAFDNQLGIAKTQLAYLEEMNPLDPKENYRREQMTMATVFKKARELAPDGSVADLLTFSDREGGTDLTKGLAALEGQGVVDHNGQPVLDKNGEQITLKPWHIENVLLSQIQTPEETSFWNDPTGSVNDIKTAAMLVAADPTDRHARENIERAKGKIGNLVASEHDIKKQISYNAHLRAKDMTDSQRRMLRQRMNVNTNKNADDRMNAAVSKAQAAVQRLQSGQKRPSKTTTTTDTSGNKMDTTNLSDKEKTILQRAIATKDTTVPKVDKDLGNFLGFAKEYSTDGIKGIVRGANYVTSGQGLEDLISHSFDRMKKGASRGAAASSFEGIRSGIKKVMSQTTDPQELVKLQQKLENAHKRYKALMKKYN